jgi:hypothetical protein
MIGKILAERYEVVQQLGKRTGRQTLLARDLKNQELVVINWGGDNPPETLMGQRLSCVVVKKDRQHNCYTPAYPKKMLPTFYQTHLQKQLAPAQFILLTILLNLIQSEKQVR